MGRLDVWKRVGSLWVGRNPASPPAPNTLYSESFAKGLLQWNYSAGTPSSQYGFNVSSISDNATGDLTWNFLTDMSAAAYVVFGMVYDDVSTDSMVIIRHHSESASSVRLVMTTRVLDGSPTAIDQNGAAMIIGRSG